MKLTIAAAVLLLLAPALEAQIWSGRALALVKIDVEDRWVIKKTGSAFSTPARQVEFALLAVHATCTKLGFSFFRLLEQDSESRESYVFVNTESIALPDTPAASLIAQISKEALEGSEACESSDDKKLDASLEKRIPKAIKKWEKKTAKEAARGDGS